MVFTTKTDDTGKWMFDDLDLTTIAGGTIGKLNVTDKNSKAASEVEFVIKDTTAPIVATQLIKAEQGDLDALQNPKVGIASASDETTPTNKLNYAFVTSTEERKAMINQLGVHEVKISVSDEVGNTTVVTTQVIVYPVGETIVDDYVVGNDLSVNFDRWESLSDDEKRALILEKGLVKGYEIKDNAGIDVTDNPEKMIVTFPTDALEVNKSYPVTLTVNQYSKIINLTLLPNTVKMTIKQVYDGSEEPIYRDLEKKIPVDNTNVFEVVTEQNMEQIIQQQISEGNLSLNYEGYEEKEVPEYKIYQKGMEVKPTPTEVPHEDFSVVYSYHGQLKFREVAQNLNFGSIEITGDKSTTPLSDSSDQTISIINTTQNVMWSLKASLSADIRRNNQKKFLGRIIYKNDDGTQRTINESPVEIEKQMDDSLYRSLKLKNGKSGLYVYQDIGNLKGIYKGTMIWSLEDSPRLLK